MKNEENDFSAMFNEMFGGFGESGISTEDTLTNAQYKIAKATSNLKLCKMKSGVFKILDYYENQVGPTYVSVMIAKRAYIKRCG